MITSESVISVRLVIPDSAILAPLFPRDNRWAPRLLSRLLRNRIEAADVTVKTASYAFPFNISWYLFTVIQRPAGTAMAAVREELAAVGVIGWAQIAWKDQDELVWRLYYPESGVFRAPAREEFDAELKLASEGQQAAKQLLQQLLQQYGTSGQ